MIGKTRPQFSAHKHHVLHTAYKLTLWNDDRNLKVGRRTANFRVYYACDDTTATHVLDLESYNHTHNGLSPCQTWLFLSPDPPAP